MRANTSSGICVAIAASKGGSGKTSLTANLLVRAAEESRRVAAFDYDPQQSLARWYELRGGGPLNNPRIWSPGPIGGAVADVDRLKGQGADWIFLDLPPATQHLIRAGIEAADFVLIPVKPSPIDLEAIDSVLDLCARTEKPFAFLLTMYDPKWKLSETARTYLEKIAPGHLMRSVMAYRQAYVGAMIGGQTGPEYNQDARQAKAAKEEVDAIWLELRALAITAAREAAA